MVNKREVLANVLDKTGCNRILQRVGGWNGLLVLNYHRIGQPEDSLFDRPLWSATVEAFEEQIRYLSLNFDIVTISDMSHVLKSKSGRHLMVTFDDGYLDNYEFAYPILKSHGCPATFFLTSGFLDRTATAWWDEIAWMVCSSKKSKIEADAWHDYVLTFDEPDRNLVIHHLISVYKSLPADQTEDFLNGLADSTGSGRCPTEILGNEWMSWDMVREMDGAGMSIGGHTVSHPILSTLDAETLEFEIGHCKQRIEQELGSPISAFSYPVGSRTAFNDETKACLKRHGIQHAFSYYGGFQSSGETDLFDLPRVAIETDVSMSRFRTVTALPQWYSQKYQSSEAIL